MAGNFFDQDWRWLESTVKLQTETYGFDIVAIQGDPLAQSEMVKENVLPLMVETLELLNEVSWKYWAQDRPFVRRDEVLKEAVDVAHFLGNILVAVGVTDDEFWEAYQSKQETNRQRQREGYTVETKR